MAEKLKFSEFVDLILARLYDLEMAGNTGFIELNPIAAELDPDIPVKWVWDAAKVLEARDLANCHYMVGGVCIAELTGEGRMLVERDPTPIIEQYRENPSQFIVVTGSGNQVVVAGDDATTTQTKSVLDERRPALALIEEIETTLSEDEAISPEEKGDLKSDLEGVRGQLGKRNPNREVLASLLTGLSQVRSIAGSVAGLVRILNP